MPYALSEITQIVTAIGILLAAIGSLIGAAATVYNIGVSRANSKKIDLAAEKIEVVHQATNGLTAKLVNLTASSSKAEGNLEGRAELKQEQAVS
jgi:hypothetical protein